MAPTVRHLDSAALRENRVAWVAPEHPAATSVVGCGPAAARQEIVIVDPATRRQCAPDEVGEIWIGGANVAVGTGARPAETEETFRASPLRHRTRPVPAHRETWASSSTASSSSRVD